VIEEEWFRGNHLYGIVLEFRRDGTGTLATATGYQFGYQIWVVRFDVDC
jgi:hypothetical protein